MRQKMIETESDSEDIFVISNTASVTADMFGAAQRAAVGIH